jgi:hypothetical protein
MNEAPRLNFEVRHWLALGAVLAGNCVFGASAREVTLAERKSITVIPPTRESIVVPKTLSGLHTVPGKCGEEYRIDFAEAYRDGYQSGWKLCVECFADGRFDLDEDVDFLDLFGPTDTPSAEAFFPGRAAAAQACHDALRLKTKQDNLVILPARTAWQRRLEKSGGFVQFDTGRRPTDVWWPYTEKSAKVDDALVLSIFGEMPVANIEHVEISNTAISDRGFARLPSMPKLASLRISSPLTGASFAALANFPKLAELEAHGLRVSAEDAAALADLPDLVWLDLIAAELEDAALAQFARIRKLDGLLIDRPVHGPTGAKPSADSIAKLATCRQLTLLSLDRCDVNDHTVEILARGLPQLKELFLRKTKVTDASLPFLRAMERLEVLALDETAVSSDGLTKLAGHPALKELWLTGTTITDDVIPFLARLPKLEKIWLSDTHVTAEGAALLRSASPHVRVTLGDH